MHTHAEVLIAEADCDYDIQITFDEFWRAVFLCMCKYIIYIHVYTCTHRSQVCVSIQVHIIYVHVHTQEC